MTHPWPFGDLVPGGYKVILADPPWSYTLYSKKGEGRSASRHYATMKLDDIKALPVCDLAARDCHLFLWTTAPNLPQAFEVMAAWGFKYSSVAFDWVKLTRKSPTLFFDRNSFHVGMGHTTRKNLEYCLLGRKGSPKRLRKDIRALIIEQVREHSRKPEQSYERIESYAEGPRLDLFARTTRPGWDAWGNEVGKFDPERLAA